MRRGLAAALLALAAAGAALLAAEIAVRVLRPGFAAGADPFGNPFWRFDPGLGWFHHPGETGTFSREEFSHPVVINAMGFRDRERTPAGAAGPPGKPAAGRIAVLGDSFTWGHGVADGEIFTRLLEGLLPGTEAWNLGVSGYATDQELLLLRRFGDRVRPDLVLVMVSRNDFEGNIEASSSGYPKPLFVERDGRLVLTNVPVPLPSASTRFGSWLRRRSAFANGLAFLFEDAFRGGEGARPPREEEIARTLRILDLLKEESARLGARLAIGIVPTIAHVYFGPLSELEQRRQDALETWGRRAEVAVIDLAPAFRAAHATTGRWLHFRRDKHWTAEGHRVAAEALARELPALLQGGAPRP